SRRKRCTSNCYQTCRRSAYGLLWRLRLPRRKKACRAASRYGVRTRPFFCRRARVSVSLYRCHPDGHQLSFKFSADRGCDGRRRPVASRAVDSTSSRIDIALHRVFLLPFFSDVFFA
ncbi:hypothetical protein EDB85DRAFT_2294721, partial [Lactarius pseudohatsudake]